MSREWKPGDVAMVNDCTRPDAPWESATCVAVRTPNREATWLLHDTAGEVWSSVSDARPLVVIDPEDREQVAALVRAFFGALPPLVAPNIAEQDNAMQAALQSLAADPKPKEPTGLGAVVEDADGCQFVRRAIDWTDSPWVPARAAGFYEWADIAAVKVLHEGVTQ